MEKGLVSFVIPTYRHFEGVPATLDSVFMQDYPRIELILADDGSPEFEREAPALREYIEARRGPNITAVRFHHLEQNQGTVRNCNSAYRLAEGEYLKDLSPEDTLSRPDALSRYVRFLEEGGFLCCFARQQGVAEDGRIIRHLASSAEDYDAMSRMTPAQLRERLFVRNCLPAPAFFARTELFRRHGYYPEEVRLIEDYPYWLRLCAEGVRFGFLDETLVSYRLTGSGMGRYGPAFMKDMYVIYDQFIFPFDHRYGPLQPLYNGLKRAGLNAYSDRARWEEYSPGQKALAWLKHGLFFCYIDAGEALMRRKNGG